MSDFDDLIKNKEVTEPRLTPPPNSPKAKQAQLEAKSLVEMLTDDGDVNTLGQKLNLDKEMTEKVLVPLINFLDKYGVGESLSTNPTVSRGSDLLSFVTDVAPVVKSAAEYFQGKKQTLSDEDAAFLEKIKEAQNVESLSLFIGDDVEEEDEEDEVAEAEEVAPHPLSGANPFLEGVDWEEILAVPPQFKEKSGVYGTIGAATKQTNFGITGLEELAAEHGVSVHDVMSSDRQSKTNASGGGGVDYTDSATVAGIDLGLGEIQKAMASENQRIANTTKVEFGTELQVPENVESTYDPMTVTGYVPPTISGLQTMEELMAEANVDSFEVEDEPESETPEVEELVEFMDEELIEQDDGSFLDPTTGESYEAVDDLTGVPEDYFGDEEEDATEE